ncbi:tetratricopeptide repeat-containing sensor histidine kinase [Mucilaginibacter gossypii]|uniref:histidine kinase n=1 Tax=Mucilaginibacter gossypii TaxID=551996 RepID=A0A1G8N3W5_9SPHI|nr:sensor histidine kinase [Mucilaginibacter gossypii]SDI74833.1 Two-component sensor histidine kinase, contains HisKA and HATPase domains [Mucilaginibacter gossypii]
MKKVNSSTSCSFPIIILVISISVLIPCMVHAQFYPAPRIVPADQEQTLLRQMRNSHSKLEHIDVLLKLSNIHYNKPLKNYDDFPIAMRYANQARALSISLGNSKKSDEALFSLATIYILEDSLKDAEKLLPSVKDSTIRNNIQIGLAYTYIFCPQRPLADALGAGKFYAEEALALSSRLNLIKNKLQSMHFLSYVHILQGHDISGEKELLNIINEYKSSHIDGVQYLYASLADIHWNEGKYTVAIIDIQNALDVVAKSSDSTALGDLYLDQMIIYGRISEYSKERFAAQSSLNNFAKRLGRYTPQFVISTIAHRLIRKHQNERALDYLNLQTKIFIPITADQKSEIVSAYASCYLALGQIDKAEEYFLKSFSLTRDRGWLASGNYSELGYFYVEHKEFRKARPYLLKSLEKQDSHTPIYERRHLYYMLFLADSAAGNYLSAMNYLNKNHRLDDSIENSKRQADVQKLLIQFESQKKEAEIKTLKQKNIVSHLSQERAIVIRNVIIITAALFLIIAAVFYWQFRSKKKLSDVISQKNKKQEVLLNRLNRVLTEKEWLLKEVHHRVKNNLHTVMCLLESQASYLESDALQAIEDSKHRIYAMSLIHQRLYETEDMKSIDLKSYITQFVGYLKESFILRDKIRIELDIEQMQLEVPVAIPLALIINEAITNSIKHAFPGKLRGIIMLTLRKREENLHLVIEDNGIGIADTKALKNSNSLGMKLINGLCEDLNGNMAIHSINGTKITIICNLNPLEKELKRNEVWSAE